MSHSVLNSWKRTTHQLLDEHQFGRFTCSLSKKYWKQQILIDLALLVRRIRWNDLSFWVVMLSFCLVVYSSAGPQLCLFHGWLGVKREPCVLERVDVQGSVDWIQSYLRSSVFIYSQTYNLLTWTREQTKKVQLSTCISNPS